MTVFFVLYIFDILLMFLFFIRIQGTGKKSKEYLLVVLTKVISEFALVLWIYAYFHTQTIFRWVAIATF